MTELVSDTEREKGSPIFIGEIEECQKNMRMYNQALAELSTQNIVLTGAKKALEEELIRVKFNEEESRLQHKETQKALGDIDMLFCRLSKCLVAIKELVENSCWEEADNGIKKKILTLINELNAKEQKDYD